MANFETHLGVGTAVASFAALSAHAEGLSHFPQTQWLFMVGVSASLLPDLDADDSRPVRLFFALLGLVAGFFLATALWHYLGFLELVLLWAGVWSFAYFPLRLLFARLTVHRGTFHSLLMACVVALVAVNVADRWLAISPMQSWLFGAFALLGYLTHLVLDEMASVDLAGNRVKRSFGTALKPFSVRYWPVSLLILGLGLGLLVLAPPPPGIKQWPVHSDWLKNRLQTVPIDWHWRPSWWHANH